MRNKVHHGSPGWVMTQEDVSTYAIRIMEQFEVMDMVLERLKEERDLDFSKYAGLTIGHPFDIPFIVRRKRDS